MHPIFAAYWARLNELHEEILRTVDDVPREALDWSAGADLNSIAVLATHVAGAERFWIGERVGDMPSHRDRDSEFRVQGADAADLRQRLDGSSQVIRDVLEGLSPDDLLRSAGNRPATGEAVTVTWVLDHILAHTAEHVGHIQITRRWWETTKR